MRDGRLKCPKYQEKELSRENCPFSCNTLLKQMDRYAMKLASLLVFSQLKDNTM